MDNFNYIKKWEIGGIFWIIIVGSLLHFAFDWSGNSKFVALFTPVNESVWEHLKLGYFSLLFFSIIEYPFLRKYTTTFFFGKFLGILVLEFTVLIMFYSYHFIFKDSSFIVDVSSYLLGAVLCQVVSIKVMKMNISKTTNILSLIGFIVLGFVLSFFTFFPPELGIFRDSNTGKYGIH